MTDAAAFRPLVCLSAIIDSRCRLKPIDRLVALALVKYADGNGECFPSYETIAADTGIPRRTVARSLETLVAAVADDSPLEVRRTHRARQDGRGGRSSNLYVVRLRVPATEAVNALLSASVALNGGNSGGGLSANGAGLSAKTAGVECQALALDLPSDLPRDLPRGAAPPVQLTLTPVVRTAKKTRKPGRPFLPLADDFTPTDEDRAAGTRAGLDAHETTLAIERFRLHARSRNRKSADWHADLQAWLLGTKPGQRTNGARFVQHDDGERLYELAEGAE